jgi:hypothetical protein
MLRCSKRSDAILIFFDGHGRFPKKKQKSRFTKTKLSQKAYFYLLPHFVPINIRAYKLSLFGKFFSQTIKMVEIPKMTEKLVFNCFNSESFKQFCVLFFDLSLF